jgi:hypothetical protein
MKFFFFVFFVFLGFAFSAFAFVGIGSSPVWVATNQGPATGGGSIPAGSILWAGGGDLMAWGNGDLVTWE